MNEGLKIKRCNFLPEGEMAIIKDTNTLIHNIVDSELKEKGKEIQKIREELKSIKENYKVQLEYDEHLEYKINKAIEYLTEEGVCIMNKGKKK